MSIELVLLPRVSYRDQEITSPRLRGLLALLAGDPHTGASAARLVDGLWPDEQPENPTKALQILVSRVRGQLGPDVIVTTPTGYRLALSEDQVDSSAIMLSASASARQSRAGDHVSALAHAEAGLALWDGGVGDAAPDDPLSALRAERVPAYRSLARARALALARLGRPAEAAESLAALVRERPRDEELLLELLRAEAATAGPATALARYDEYRRTLRDELGTDPGPALRAEYRTLLEGEAPTVRHGVPHEPNPLLGRDDDIAAVSTLLRTSRVTSIVGPGGLGKTRLANVVGRLAEQRVVYLVALAGVTTDEDVVNEVASALGVGEARPGAPRDVLRGIVEVLGTGPVLLVLDNCEHVIRGAAELVGALVSMTRSLRVLTTSRAPLGLSSESVYPLPELRPPVAVELFEQRARAARPGVELPAEVVRELCGHLDGLPLAVELAAARVRVMSVAEIASRLGDRFALLRGGPRDAPARHQTLRAVVDWSWNLLEPAGQRALRALSIFPGGFTAAAAGQLVEDADVLEDLVDQSLLKVLDTPAGTRFGMLETVRELSAARRDEAGETGPVTTAYLAWARDFGMAYYCTPYSQDPFASVTLIRTEQDNLVQALRLAVAAADGTTAAATAAVLGGLWMIESNFARLGWLAGEILYLLSHFTPAPEFVEVTRAALAQTAIYGFFLEGPRATRSLAALRRLPAAAGTPTVNQAVSIVLSAAVTDRAAFDECCDSDEPMVAGLANSIAGYLYENEGDLDNAMKAAERTLEAFQGLGVPWLSAIAHARLSELCMQVERADEVVRHLHEALPLYEALGVRSDVAGIQLWMVLANLQRGALDEAERWLEQASPSTEDAVITMTYGIGVRAEIALARGEVEAGLRLWRRAYDVLLTSPDATPGQDPWFLEVRAVTVVAHARHGRLQLVEEIIAGLPGALSTLLERPTTYVSGFPVAGALLLAMGMVDIARGRPGPGARTIALAERLRFMRGFQPTMASAAAREAAEHADRSAYADAVSSYADLGQDELRAAARSLLAERG